MTPARLLDPNGHPVIAHRGASGSAPENTLAAFDLAARSGAEAFELDVRLAADGVPVIVHDFGLERTTDRFGPVAARTAVELAGYDAGARFSPDGGTTFPFRGRGIGIPTLEEVLTRHPTMPVLIELKVATAAGPVGTVLRRTGAAQRCAVASFLPEAVEAFREPPFSAGASRREILALAVESWLGPPRPRGISLYAVPVRYKNIIPVPTRRFVAAARRLGCPVHVWTVNDTETADQLWDRGCAGMITNYPEMLRAARDRRFG